MQKIGFFVIFLVFPLVGNSAGGPIGWNLNLPGEKDSVTINDLGALAILPQQEHLIFIGVTGANYIRVPFRSSASKRLTDFGNFTTHQKIDLTKKLSALKYPEFLFSHQQNILFVDSRSLSVARFSKGLEYISGRSIVLDHVCHRMTLVVRPQAMR